MKKIVLIIICTILANFLQAANTGKVFNVRDFGATGNGKKDDYSSIIRCINEALKEPESIIEFPSGRYLLSQTLFVESNATFTIRGVSSAKKPVLFTKTATTVLSIKSIAGRKGDLKISNLSFESKNPRFSQNHPFINKKLSWKCGIKVFDKDIVHIDDVSIKDVYGFGIHISANAAYIDKAIINDCWGFNPVDDNHGDGIYVWYVFNGSVTNCIVVNNFNKTGQLGRAGIVLEYECKNINVQNNYVSGYDRGIHIESDYGNLNISENNVSGSDLGILIGQPQIDGKNYPVVVNNNTISNRNLKMIPGLQKIWGARPADQPETRTLLSIIADSNSRDGTVISNNTIILDGNYSYFANSIIDVEANGISLINNKISLINQVKLNKPIKVRLLKNTIMKSNISKNLSTIYNDQ